MGSKVEVSPLLPSYDCEGERASVYLLSPCVHLSEGLLCRDVPSAMTHMEQSV
jgi:hypothetical protein